MVRGRFDHLPKYKVEFLERPKRRSTCKVTGLSITMPRPINEKTQAIIKDLKDLKRTMAYIAAKHGVSKQRVSTIAKEHGLSRRKKKVHKPG